VTSGNLEQVTAADIFRQLLASGVTGRLRVTGGGERRTVYFENGRPVYAVSSAIPERLGEILVRFGRITQAQLLDGLKLATVAKRVGTILVEQGAIAPHDLVWGIKLQVKEIILSLFTLESGTFRFEVTPLDDENIVKLNLKPQTLIQEGVRRITNPKVLLRRLGTLDGFLEVSRHSKPEVGGVPLEEAERGLFESIRGRRFTVRDICQRSKLPSLETCRFLVMLLGLGLATRALPD